jgi:hypothetical protein
MSLTKATYSMIQGAPANPLDYMTGAERADVLSGTGALDVSAAVQTAFDTSDTIEFPRGTYRIETTVTSTTAKTIIGNDSKIIGTVTPFQIIPTLTSYSGLSTALTKAIDNVTASIIPAAVVGSTVTFRSTTVRQPEPGSIDYTYGQVVKIVRIDSGTAWFYPEICEAFTINSAEVAAPCENICVRDLYIDISQGGLNTFGLDIVGSRVNIDNVSVEGSKTNYTDLPTGEASQQVGIYVHESVDVKVQNCSIKNIRFNGGSWGYGVAVYGSNLVIIGGTYFGCRHAVDSGARSYICPHVVFNGLVAAKDNTVADWQYVVGTHSNVVDWTVTGCALYGRGNLLYVDGGEANIVGNSFYLDAALKFGPWVTGEGTVVIALRDIQEVNITGNNFTGLPNVCINVRTTGTNNKLNIYGNNYAPGSTVLYLDDPFSFATAMQATPLLAFTRDGYSVRYPFSYTLPAVDSAGGHRSLSNTNSNYTEVWVNDAASSPYGWSMRYTLDPNDSSSEFIECRGAANTRFVVQSNGNCANTTGTYGAISDVKLKQDIVDASSQWADIKALKFKKYRLKADVATNSAAPTLMGLVAQEVEALSPGLVEERPDLDEDKNDLGTVTKTVKYSIVYMKAVKALQEAMERIETLENEVALLKNA